MTNDNKNLCTECAALYRDNGYPVKTLVQTGKCEKCAECGKTRPVSGALGGERSRR